MPYPLAIRAGTDCGCCAQWRRAYVLDCQSECGLCSWQPSGDASLALCSSDYDNEFVEAGDGLSAVLYGPKHPPPCPPPESDDTDAGLVPQLSAAECIARCPCHQWIARYEHDCSQTPCAWRRIHDSTQWLPCVDPPIESEFVPDAGTNCIGTLYGQLHCTDVAEDLDEQLLPGVDCGACCQCLQWSARYVIVCDGYGNPSWELIINTEVEDTCVDVENTFVWDDGHCSGKLYGFHHFGTAPKDLNLNNLPAIADTDCCQCSQWSRYADVECISENECRWKWAGDAVKGPCVEPPGNIVFYDNCSATVFGAHHYGPNDVPDLSLDVLPGNQDECYLCCECHQRVAIYDVSCTDASAVWNKVSEQVLPCGQYDNTFIPDPSGCGGTYYGPRHLGLNPPALGDPPAPDPDHSVCCPCRQWVGMFKRICHYPSPGVVTCTWELEGVAQFQPCGLIDDDVVTVDAETKILYGPHHRASDQPPIDYRLQLLGECTTSGCPPAKQWRAYYRPVCNCIAQTAIWTKDGNILLDCTMPEGFWQVISSANPCLAYRWGRCHDGTLPDDNPPTAGAASFSQCCNPQYGWKITSAIFTESNDPACTSISMIGFRENCWTGATPLAAAVNNLTGSVTVLNSSGCPCPGDKGRPGMNDNANWTLFSSSGNANNWTIIWRYEDCGIGNYDGSLVVTLLRCCEV